MKLDELLTQLIIIVSTILLLFCGILGLETMKYCIYAIVILSFLKILFIRFSVAQFIAFLGLLLSSLFTLVNYGGSFSSLIVSISSIFLAISLFGNGIGEGTWKLVKVCTYAVSLMFIVYAFWMPNWTIYDQLVLYFENPNMAGIALCAPSMILVTMLFETKPKWKILLNFAILLCLSYMVYMTQNRGSLFSLLFLIFVAVFAVNRKKERRLTSSRWFALLKLTPIFVMFLYIGMFLILPDNIEVLGKPLFSGREEAWIVALKQILFDPFTHHTFEEGTLNLFLEGAARYGIVSMISYFGILISFSKRKEDLEKMGRVNYLAYVAFHFCLFQQSFESTLFTGSYTVYIWTYLLLAIATMQLPRSLKDGEENKI